MLFLEINGLSKTYTNGSVGLLPTDLALERGERLVLLGPSGSGKSTLLRLLCGLEEPDGGEILLNGERIDRLPPHKRGIGFVPQKPALYPQWDVRRNLEVSIQTIPPPPAVAASRQSTTSPSRGEVGVVGFDSNETPNRQLATSPPEGEVGRTKFGRVGGIPFSDVEELLHLTPLLYKYPHELSGGERQRVALAKLLLRNAPLWLLDEPFSHLDSPFRAGFRHELHLMLERASATMILVTHDPADAWALGTRFGVIEGGVLRDAGKPGELRTNPPFSFAAFSLASYQRIDGFVERKDSAAHGRRETQPEDVAGAPVFVSDCGSVRIPIPPRIAQGLGTEPTPRMTFGVRPEDIIARLPGSLPPSFEVPVELRGWPPLSAEPAGSGWLLTVARGNTRLRTEWRTDSPPPVGQPIDWVIAAERGLWFDGRTGDRL